MALAAALLVAGCRPATPSPSDWQSSAEQSVTDMVSEVATARLTVQQALRDRFVGRYDVVVLTYAEEAAGKASDSVSTVQPPLSRRKSHDTVTNALDDATDAITQARIAVTDGDVRTSTAAIKALDDSLDQLRVIEKQLGTGR